MSQSPNDHLLLLLRLSQDLNGSLDPDHVLERTMDDVLVVTRAERGFVMLSDAHPMPGARHLRQVMRGMEQASIDAQEFTYSRGVVDQVMNTGEPILTSDAQTDQRFSARASIIMQNLRSILCVPLKSKEKLLGAIYVDSRIQKVVFTKQDLEMLEAVAASAAIAIENARLYHETQTRLNTLHLLRNISQEITATLDLQRVLTATTQAVKELLTASAASILTVDGDELVFQVAIGESSEILKPFRIPIGQGIAGWVISHREPVLSNNVGSDPRFYGSMDQKTGFSTQSLIAVPLIVNEKAIGVIEVFNKPGGFDQGDLELLVTFSSNAAFAIENARLYQVAVEKGRLERELQVARQVQASLLPREIPPFPGWQIAAGWLPAREVAGDYYDFVMLEAHPGEPQKMGVVIADVADKGMPAALFMVDVRSTLRASLYSDEAPDHSLLHANVLLCEDASDGMFVTLFYALLEDKSNTITYVNAGHNPPLLFRAGNSVPENLTRTGLALGVEPSLPYTQRDVQMFPGDVLVCFTDGFPDALNMQGQEYSMERFTAVAAANLHLNAAGIQRAIERDLQEFVGPCDRFDDLTLVILKKE